jgi:hypothetical protein
MKTPASFLLLAALAALPATAGEPAGPVFSDPLSIDNELFPFAAGGVKVYLGRSDGEHLAVVDLYLEETRLFDLDGTPVECAILQETEFEGGQIKEISRNYFAQADDGGVWYFGEVVDDYEDGVVVDHEGSWLVGGPTDPSDPPETADAPAPALFMPADPQVGDTWKPEDLFPLVDETVEMIADDVKVKVPAGKFEDAIKVKETSQLDDGFEHKWYVPGLGFVKAKEPGEQLAYVAGTFEAADDEP